MRKRAEEVNESFANYIDGLKPNDAVMNLYREILQDIRGEQGRERLKEAEALRKEVHEVEDKLNTLDDKWCRNKVSDEDHERISNRYKKQIEELQVKIGLLTNGSKEIGEKIDYSFNLLNNLRKIMIDGPVNLKCKLLGSMFFDKIVYDGKNYRTKNYNQVLDLIFQETNKLHGNKNGESEDSPHFESKVPRPGLEPGWVAPLVFETSASTDSAIWAQKF